MMKIFTLTLILSVSACFAQAQTTKFVNDPNAKKQSVQTESAKPATIEASSELPADFPKFVDTGNPAQDKINYINAKYAWYDSHPEMKSQMLNEVTSEGKSIITKEKYDSLSPERKKYVDENPDRFFILR